MVVFIRKMSLSTQSIKTIERVVTASIPARVMEVSQIIPGRHCCRPRSIWCKAQTFDGYSKIDQGSLLACTTRMFEIHLMTPKSHRDLSEPLGYTQAFELTSSRHPTIHFSKNKTVSSPSVADNFRHPRRGPYRSLASRFHLRASRFGEANRIVRFGVVNCSF